MAKRRKAPPTRRTAAHRAGQRPASIPKPDVAPPRPSSTAALDLPPPREARDLAVMLKLTATERATLAAVAARRGEPLATTTRMLALAAARATLDSGT